MKKHITLIQSKDLFKGTSLNIQTLGCLLTLLLASCTKENSSNDRSEQLFLKKTDSILVNYDGVFYLRDYHPDKEFFLAEDYQSNRLIEFNKDGDIVHLIQLQQDGPNRLETYQAGINYLGDSIAFLLSQNKIVFFDRAGELKGEVPFEEGSFYLNGIIGDNVFKLGNKLAYLRPENMEMIEDYSDLFGSVYAKPILELFDPSTKQRKYTMPFPTGSIYQSGSYRFWTFPTVKKKENDYYLFFHGEPWFYHYKEINQEILFQQKVLIPETVFVQRKAVAMNQADDYWEINNKIIQGRIAGVYPLEKGIVVIYRKGLDEKITTGYNIGEWEIRRMLDDQYNPYLWAFFDQEMKALIWDQACPEGLIWTSSYTKNGEIVAIKDQEFYGKEEKHQTLYLFQAIKSQTIQE